MFNTKHVFDVTNHPVHIVDKNMNLSPSSFIPFCEFGGNMSALGVKIDQFDVPVCNSFKAKILNDQLCYEVDVNEIISKPFTANDLKLGLALLIDENWDRQYNLTMPSTESSGKIFEEFKKPKTSIFRLGDCKTSRRKYFLNLCFCNR